MKLNIYMPLDCYFNYTFLRQIFSGEKFLLLGKDTKCIKCILNFLCVDDVKINREFSFKRKS